MTFKLPQSHFHKHLQVLLCKLFTKCFKEGTLNSLEKITDGSKQQLMSRLIWMSTTKLFYS